MGKNSHRSNSRASMAEPAKEKGPVQSKAKPCLAMVGAGHVLISRSAVLELLDYIREASGFLGAREEEVLEHVGTTGDIWIKTLESVSDSIRRHRVVGGTKVAIEPDNFKEE